jgi:hypothetical protein
MGTVYVAVARGPAGFSKLKVVKRLRPDLAMDPHFLTMFLDEARIAARFNHPNIVQTFEVGFDGTHYFIEMEYLEGQTYDALMCSGARYGPVPLPLTVWVLKEALAGLHHAHESKDAAGAPMSVVHRDVSPHNVFVTYDGAVKVLDFGIARAAGSMHETRTGVVRGKATYMAPEQAARRPVDRRADIFSVGVMLWEAITGTRLWGGASDTEIFAALRDGAIRSPRSVQQNLDPVLESVCNKALSIDPDQRHATAAELQSALEDWLASSGRGTGAKALGGLLAARFTDQRRAVQAAIDLHEQRSAQLGEASPIEVPTLLETLRVLADTPGEKLSASRTMPHAVAKSPSKQRARPPPIMLRVALAAALVPLLAGGLLLAVRRQTTARPTSLAQERPAAAVCALNRECTARLGAAAVCSRTTLACTPLESPDCRVLAEPDDIDDDRTVWFGTMFGTKDAGYRAFEQPAENAVELARRDFVEMLRGVSPSTSSAVRRFALVACDDSSDARRAADHLVAVGVPAVIGFTRDVELVDLATSRFAPAGVLAMAAANSTAIISDLGARDGIRLVWRTTVSVAQWGEPMSAMVSGYFESALRRPEGSATSGHLRVAFVRRSDASALAFGDALLSHLTIDGRPAVQNDRDLRQIVLDGPASIADAARAVVEFTPHLLVLFDGWDVLVPLVREVERTWPAGGRARPTYFFPWMLASHDLFDFIGTDPLRQRRFFGLSTPAKTTTNAKFVLRYNEVFREHTTLADSPSTAYDAAYLLAYAANAVPAGKAVNGRALAERLARFGTGGPTLEVGPAGIAAAVRAAQAGESFHLLGTTGDLTLDPRAGGIQADEELVCVAVDEHHRAFDGRESGLRWDVRARSLVGKVSCF